MLHTMLDIMGEDCTSFSLTQSALFISQTAVIIYTNLNTFFLQKLCNVKKIATIFWEQKNYTSFTCLRIESVSSRELTSVLGFLCLSYRWTLLGLHKANTRSQTKPEIWYKNGISWSLTASYSEKFCDASIAVLQGQFETDLFSYKTRLYF